MTTIFFDKVIVIGPSPADRIEVGPGFSCPEGGSATPQASANGPVNLTATAYLGGIALNPQPEFQWESDNPAAAVVDETGAVTRSAGNTNAVGYDSNGASSVNLPGGLANIRAYAKNPNGSVSGIYGSIVVIFQCQSAPTVIQSSAGSQLFSDTLTAFPPVVPSNY